MPTTPMPAPGDLWQRKPGTLPAHYGMTLRERPAEELRDTAYLTEVTDKAVSWRRDAGPGPALYRLPLAVFLRNFRLLMLAQPAPDSSASSSEAATTE